MFDFSNKYSLTHYFSDVAATVDDAVNDNHFADYLINYPKILNYDLAAQHLTYTIKFGRDIAAFRILRQAVAGCR